MNAHCETNKQWCFGTSKNNKITVHSSVKKSNEIAVKNIFIKY